MSQHDELARGIARLIARVRRLTEELEARREIMEWTAARLRVLRQLPPHEWDRSSLEELAQALTSNPKLGREAMTPPKRYLKQDSLLSVLTFGIFWLMLGLVVLALLKGCWG